jgi:hypothetical protein
VDLREMAVWGEDQNTLRGFSERKRFLAVGSRHLGDDELPRADQLVPQRLTLLPGSLAARQREREHGGGNRHELQEALPSPVFDCAEATPQT